MPEVKRKGLFFTLTHISNVVLTVVVLLLAQIWFGAANSGLLPVSSFTTAETSDAAELLPIGVGDGDWDGG